MLGIRACGLGVLAVLASVSVAAGGEDPTPAEISATWKSMSGGLDAKAVFWKPNGIWTMDLKTGRSTQILDGLRRKRGETAMGPYPVWSPDAKRIVFFDPGPPRRYKVMNADGSNVKTIYSGSPWTYGTCSWWTASGTNDWVIVQADGPGYSVLKRIRVDANNNPVETVPVVDFKAYGGKGREWISMSGDYVAWTDWGANPGGNRCVIRNWKTGKEHEVCPRSKDACSVVLKPDGSGTCLYCPGWHGRGAAQTFDGKTLFDWRPLGGGLIEMLRWSNHSDFICVMDNRQKRDPRTQRTWIRKANKSGKPFLFLGYGIWSADLHVESGRAKAEPAPRKSPTVRATRPATIAVRPIGPDPEEKATGMLRLATQMLKHRQFARQNKAVIETRLKKVIETYPGTSAAGKARELLEKGW